MGGGRGLLGREPLGPGGGCSEEEALSPWPPLRWPRAVPRRASPSLTFAAIEWPRCPPRCCPLPRSACLCSRNSAPGPRCCHWAPRAQHTWLDSGPRSSCRPGSRYTRDTPPTARPLRATSTTLTAGPAALRPETRAVAAGATHRTPRTD
ncbi:CAAX box protein 1-like [Suricata suricatta]|uniref:CAAX box protein 1-like n=1 Tax=Suricata suricatta TaxID=37032 RepID=UPI0011559D73|nr:CAAX box protein 1-like [Suricata suricatta]